MVTWTQKRNIKIWVEETLFNIVEKNLPEGFELSFDGSIVSESTYLTVSNQHDSLFTIRISNHFKPTYNGEITVLMTEGEKMRTKTSIKKEVLEEVKKNIEIYK